MLPMMAMVAVTEGVLRIYYRSIYWDWNFRFHTADALKFGIAVILAHCPGKTTVSPGVVSG